VPLAGQALSLHQGFLLSYSVRSARGAPRARLLGAWVSSVAALLKSLSPAGKKLTPMLAISVQGLLHSVGTLTLGPNVFGCALGSALASLWAFVQPVLLSWLFVGAVFVEAVRAFAARLQEAFSFEAEKLLWVLVTLMVLKAVAAALLAVAAFRLRPEALDRFLVRVGSRFPAKPLASAPTPLRGAGRDLRHPVFLLSLALTALFLFGAEASWARIAWALCRPVALAFALFYAVRAFDWDRFVRRLESGRASAYGKSLQAAIARVSKQESA
jgi:hypothetical protein